MLEPLILTSAAASAAVTPPSNGVSPSACSIPLLRDVKLEPTMSSSTSRGLERAAGEELTALCLSEDPVACLKLPTTASGELWDASDSDEDRGLNAGLRVWPSNEGAAR